MSSAEPAIVKPDYWEEAVAHLVRDRILKKVIPQHPETWLKPAATPFVTLARANPEKYTFASSGSGNSTHLAGEIFQDAAKLKMLHVPYKGGGPATADLIAGHVDIQFTSVLESTGHIKGGLVRALAVTSAQRTPALPHVPTLAEAGVSHAEAGSWIALLGPANLPAHMAQQISRDIHEIITTPEIKRTLLEQGATAVGSTPEELAKVIAADSERYAQVVRKLGLKASN